MSVQLFNAASDALPNLDQMTSEGRFEELLSWLRLNVHQWGRRRSADEILLDATGSGLSAEPWLNYVRKKFGDLYDF
jgi:carboxypeptidase Taq